MSASQYRIGFDIGGTFTDFVLHDSTSQAIRLHKCLTTPHDPAVGALEGLAEIVAAAGLTLADIGEIVHGTTLVTNALIERRGAKLALLTTAGFRDLLEMGTEQRYDIYDLFLEFPDPLVPRRLRCEIPERIDANGDIVLPIDPGAVRAQVGALAAQGVEAIAVSFLHAYRNPVHEQAVGTLIRKEFPQISVSLSSEVVAELWEYQRTVTTCANAYVQPLMDGYIRRMEQALSARGFSGALRLMHSAGGLVSPQTARDLPIRLLESGPAGGGIATALFGALAGRKDVISFDMGGTTAKAALVEDGRIEVVASMEAARVHRFKKGSGLPIKAPVVDMIEIGAGGGSIAQIDEVGLLRVGPHSAGADPGPACYGRGGTAPTVTDANLVLGYYDPGYFLGGRMTLDAAAAERAIAGLGARMGLSAIDAAWGIHRIVAENMAAAARTHLVERGKDPRRYAMVGFGGAGPAFAASVARIMGVRELIIPPASGAASALGFLAAPLSYETVRSRPIRLEPGFDAAAINTLVDDLEREARARLAEGSAATDRVVVERSADMRLVGQVHEITVPLPDGPVTEDSLGAIKQAFERVYAARYSSVYDGAAIEALSFRLRVSGPTPTIPLKVAAVGGAGAALKGMRKAWFGDGFVEAGVYDRYRLGAGATVAGPAIIEELEATTVLPPGDTLVIDDGGAMRITIGASAAAVSTITPDLPVEVAAARIKADPINLEIMWSRLVTVVEEMWLTICRTAFSLIISEAQDFATELLDPTGEPLAHSPRAMPVFNLTLPLAVKALLEKYPPETLKAGDVLITNDPWLCAGHLFDIAIVTPVFREGRLVALAGTVGHVSDIGGTKDSLRAREVYEEGLQIPPMKLYEAGRPNETLFTIIGENVRNSAQVLGDIHSFVAANEIGAERLLAFMSDYGLADLRALAQVVQGLSETAMRDAVRAIPDGTYTSEVWNNPLGQKLRYPLKITVAGDVMELDFAGAPPQLAQGGLNCTLSYLSAHATYPLKCILTPNIRGNAGCYRPFVIKAPKGSILNCDKPLAVNLRTRTGWYVAPNVFRALSEALPNAVQAFTGLPIAIGIYGRNAEGRIFSDHLFSGGGQGGSARGDGKSALLYPTSAANTSIELLESRVPVLVLEKTYLPDTGGPGQNRGGLGSRVRLRKLRDDGLTTLVSVYPEGVGVTTPGLFGGQPGGAALGRVIDADGNTLHDCGPGQLVELTRTHEIVEVVHAGGAGFGEPRKRDVARVASDVADGMVSPANAAQAYGVVLADDGTVDFNRSRPGEPARSRAAE